MNTGLTPISDPYRAQLYPPTGFLAQIEHDPRDLRDGTLVLYRRWGFDIPTAEQARLPGWGIGPKTHVQQLDLRNQYSEPSASSEAIQYLDVQRCIDVAASDIVPTGVAFELVHWRLPAGAVLILEDIPTMFDTVFALDGAGIPLLQYEELNGERLCLDALVHPDPAVTVPLTWRFQINYTADPSTSFPTPLMDLAYRGPVSPTEIGGNTVLPGWNDMRNGSQNIRAASRQYTIPAGSVVRYWVTFFGPTDRFSLRMGARISGFWQSGGRFGAALRTVQTRRP